MVDTLASVERSVAVEFALAEVQRVLRRWGSLTYDVVSSQFPRQISAVLRTPDGETVHSRGKGSFPQNLASGFFEILEHAVSIGVVPQDDCREFRRVDDLYNQWSLPADHLARLFKGYGEAEILAAPFAMVTEPATHEPVWLPSAIYDENPLAGEQTYLDEIAARYWSSNGFGAGMTVDDASLHALNEVVERDAFSQFLLAAGHGHASGSPIELANGCDAASRRLHALSMSVSASTRSSIQLRLLPALAGYVVIAMGTQRDYHGRRLVGLGSSISVSYAVERALLEYEQECALEHEFDSCARTLDEDDIADCEWMADYPFLDRCFRLATVPPPTGKPVRLPQGWCPAQSDTATELSRQVAAVSARGYPVLRRILFYDPGPKSAVAATVVQVAVLGAERFHLVRSGVLAEPVGRMRDARTVELCRHVVGPGRQSDSAKTSITVTKLEERTDVDVHQGA